MNIKDIQIGKIISLSIDNKIFFSGKIIWKTANQINISWYIYNGHIISTNSNYFINDILLWDTHGEWDIKITNLDVGIVCKRV